MNIFFWPSEWLSVGFVCFFECCLFLNLYMITITIKLHTAISNFVSLTKFQSCRDIENIKLLLGCCFFSLILIWSSVNLVFLLIT